MWVLCRKERQKGILKGQKTVGVWKKLKKHRTSEWDGRLYLKCDIKKNKTKNPTRLWTEVFIPTRDTHWEWRESLQSSRQECQQTMHLEQWKLLRGAWVPLPSLPSHPTLLRSTQMLQNHRLERWDRLWRHDSSWDHSRQGKSLWDEVAV
jgi:hypothetical protein